MAAHHHSFCEDSTDKKKSCHFHTTRYLCHENPLESGIHYRVDYTKDFFPGKLTLPDDEQQIMTKHTKIKPILLEIIKYPWTHSEVESKRKIKLHKPIANPIKNQRFCTLWSLCGFKGLRAFGIKHDKKYHSSYHSNHQKFRHCQNIMIKRQIHLLF